MRIRVIEGRSDGSPSQRRHRHCTPEQPFARAPGPKVLAALKSVKELNAGPLTKPTEIEARRWVRKTFGFWGHFLEYRHQQAIEKWQEQVPIS
jgi:hypothetical protein